MGTIGKSRVVLAVLAIAFLLFNPAGICAGTMSSSASPSHPCCPHPASQPTGAASPCICIDRQPAAPTLPSLNDQGPAIAIVADATSGITVELPRPEVVGFDVPVGAPQDRSVSFHQLLL